MNRTAPAEYIAKFLTAGIDTNAASENVKNCDVADSKIDGPILPTALEILKGTDSFGYE